MEKGNKTGQEKKIQRMVNDLIKMAERRGATYYGSWIEDERQYVAGAHFCVCLNKPVELPERDGSYVKNQMYDYMENARIMNEKETTLPDELDQMVKCLSVREKTGKEHNLWKRGKWSIYCVAGIFYRRGSEKFLDGIGDILI